MSVFKTQLEEANKAKETAENDLTALEHHVKTGVVNAGLSDEMKPTAEENIALLSSKVVEYGSKDGGKPTNVHSETDPKEVEDTSGSSTSIFDSFFNTK